MAIRLAEDIVLVRELLDLSERDLAEAVGVSLMTLSRWKRARVVPSQTGLRAFYDFAFRKGIRLNEIKAQLDQEELESVGKVLLFHGSKEGLEGPVSLARSKASNDLGRGFYCGERYEQAVMFVAAYPESSVYYFAFDGRGLQAVQYAVDQDWMLTIALNRGKLAAYETHPTIKALRERLEQADYASAPIADNRMFAIIDSFIDGEITDVQCQHCLSATNLGRQYVFRTQAALEQLDEVEHCYLAPSEKERMLASRTEESVLGTDKVKVARRQYRGQGLYIDELLA